eukprot:jgi/Mesvir1/28291/Mv04814-RA.1
MQDNISCSMGPARSVEKLLADNKALLDQCAKLADENRNLKARLLVTHEAPDCSAATAVVSNAPNLKSRLRRASCGAVDTTPAYLVGMETPPRDRITPVRAPAPLKPADLSEPARAAAEHLAEKLREGMQWHGPLTFSVQTSFDFALFQELFLHDVHVPSSSASTASDDDSTDSDSSQIDVYSAKLSASDVLSLLGRTGAVKLFHRKGLGAINSLHVKYNEQSGTLHMVCQWGIAFRCEESP